MSMLCSFLSHNDCNLLHLAYYMSYNVSNPCVYIVHKPYRVTCYHVTCTY